MTAARIREKLQAMADPAQAVNLSRFFKAGPGQYGEGDRFIGVRVPQLRQLVRVFIGCPINEIKVLLKSPVHEERQLALLLLVRRFQLGGDREREAIYRLYLASTRYINNWDLVDSSAEHIVGAWLLGRTHEPLYALAESPLLWERRIAMLATFHFIKRGALKDSLSVAERLLNDEHDLIHKAVGWMLREVGKRDSALEEAFLKRHYRNMPRTMLRYAIERFPERKRQAYLKGEV